MLRNITDQLHSPDDFNKTFGTAITGRPFELFLIGYRDFLDRMFKLSNESVPSDEGIRKTNVETGMWWRHLLAGGVAGAVSRSATAPLDRIKIYLQVQPEKVSLADSVRFLVNEGGYRSMWRGNFVNVIKIAPESAIKFATYENMKRFIHRSSQDKSMSLTERFLAGATAGATAQTAIYPMEVLKTRLALQRSGQYNGILDATAKIFKYEGIKSFYRGFVPGVMGTVPYAGVDLAVYETLKRKYIALHGNLEQPPFTVALVCGSISSALGQLCSYPLALVRTRLQANAAKDLLADRPCLEVPEFPGEEGMIRLIRRILKNEGVTGLYRGITPNFMKVIPAVSIGYVIYEYVCRGLGVEMS